MDERSKTVVQPDALLSFLTPGGEADRKVFDALSSRERQVLALMADGLSNSRISEQLHIGEKTVRNHACSTSSACAHARRPSYSPHEHGFSRKD